MLAMITLTWDVTETSRNEDILAPEALFFPQLKSFWPFFAHLEVSVPISCFIPPSSLYLLM